MATILIARHRVSTGSTSLLLPFSSGPSSLTAIHNSSTPPTSFRYAICISVVTNPANMIRKRDGDHGPENHAPDALVGRELAARKRNDDGVVARQQNIDPDDLQNGEPEAGFLDNHEAVSPPLPVGVLCAPTPAGGPYPLPPKAARTRRHICFLEQDGRWQAEFRRRLSMPKSCASSFPPRQAMADRLCSISSKQTNRASRPTSRGRTMTIDPVVISPLIALIAGILILLMPRLLELRGGDLSDRDWHHRSSKSLPLIGDARIGSCLANGLDRQQAPVERPDKSSAK